jgi:hypothetical protein
MNIDYIYYVATSTDQTTGYITTVQAQYFVPFLDYLLVFTVVSFAVLITWFTFYLLYRRDNKIRVYSNLNIRKKDLWN